ncbi:DedA family protein [Aeromonas simiae]|uniref:DedA family protein n=1 Tax=Aeromonas simiae TaxID=218936 RepID=A0A5J6WYV4_9GAMM|nr:DedA family protein [Aeromonas simiae]MDO2949325.1 DedA family protein [Aeromonas simiae]MDO2952789.1 DedA family protein [Aeromonas simiae]MDO2956552.1 DedA family protein [Aeromonas simiae]QFI54515.1 DedA family protein [Aeromonas simiae]
MDLILFLIDFILHVDVHLRELFENYGIWVYAILFLIIFCETGLVVTPFLPGDSLLFAAGALTVGSVLDVHTLATVLIIAAVLGNVVNYTIGHFFGEKLFQNPHSKIFRRDHLEKTSAFYARHGGKTIIITRFLPIVRTFAPFVAGMGAMTYKRFLAFNLVGGFLWVMSFVYAGHFFGNLPVVRKNFTLLIFGIIVISLLPMVIGGIRAKLASSRA